LSGKRQTRFSIINKSLAHQNASGAGPRPDGDDDLLPAHRQGATSPMSLHNGPPGDEWFKFALLSGAPPIPMPAWPTRPTPIGMPALETERPPPGQRCYTCPNLASHDTGSPPRCEACRQQAERSKFK